MANAPHIELTGNLTKDPELKFTPGGHPVCKFTVATTPRKRNGDGTWGDGDVQYWDVTAWRNLAENVSASLMRGDPVTVIGSVDFREWETRGTDEREPEKRHQHEVTADSVSVPLAFHVVRVKRANRTNAATEKAEPANDESKVPF